MMVRGAAPSRMGHVVIRFFPMLLLGFIFLVVGLAPGRAPHIGIIQLGNLLALLGFILIVGATIGILFTKCPDCYQSWRLMCLNEPDVRSDPETGDYYRDLLADDELLD